MKIPKLEKWQIIEIDWMDSMHSSGWRYEESLGLDDKYMNHKTIGYFLKETKLALTVVQSKSDDGDDTCNIDAVMTIPKVAMKKIKKI